MAGHNELTRDVDIDIGGLFSNIWKRKRLILFLSALAGVAIFIAMNSISPRYKSTAQLIIEPRESRFTRVQQQNGGVNANEFDAAAVLSQVQIILSDDIALNTIKRLDLAGTSEFGNSKEGSLLTDLFISAGIMSEPLEISPGERILKTFKSRLQGYSIDSSRVIELTFWAKDRNLAKEVTNTIADEYLLLQKRSKLETDSDATKFLEPEIAALRIKLRSAEAKVAAFRSNSDISIGNNNALLATQQLSELSTELSRVRSQASAADAKVQSIRTILQTGASIDAIPEVAASPLIQRLRERQVQLQAQISELSTTLLPGHPRLQGLKSQMSGFQKQIRRETRGILASLEGNVTIVRNQEQSLLRELSRLKAEAARVGEAEVELRALEREATSERELLQTYMTKFREAAGRQSNEYLPVNARIISRGYLPTESFYPKTVPYTIAGATVAAILSMVGILVMALISGKAFVAVNRPGTSRSEENDHTQMSFNATSQQPVNEIAPLRPIDNATQSDLATPQPGEVKYPQVSGEENKNNISVSLAAQAILGMGKVRIAVVSPGGDEGSVSTWLLAETLAKAEKTVALMDMTGSGITTRQFLGDNSLPGIWDMLAGSAEFTQIINKSKIPYLSILPVGTSRPADANLALERLTHLVDALTEGYDYLLIDCGMADLNGLSNVVRKDSLILISKVGTSMAKTIEDELINNGYGETITFHPSRKEMESLDNLAA
ncbi:MAG: Wzz/FepE/Etk N-terminal domain-containing protein [Rhizobiaceae bacterium]|nr:Wzz/FepE/Etk N-terminal domain-containing protein [Rhizobiaceae bacterium]